MSEAHGRPDEPKLRLVVVIARYPRGDGDAQGLRCRDAARELARRGHVVTVLTSAEGGRRIDDDEGVRVVRRLRTHSGTAPRGLGAVGFALGSRSDAAALRAELRRARAQVLVYWQLDGLSHALLGVNRPRGCGVVCDVTTDWLLDVHRTGGNWFAIWERKPGSALGALLRGFGKLCARLLLRLPIERPALPPGRAYFTSQQLWKRYLAAGVGVHNAEVITPGIELELFPFEPDRPVDGPIRLLYLGPIREGQGLHTVVLALGSLPRRVVLRIVGPVEEPEYLAEVAEVARAAGATRRMEVGKPVEHADVATLLSEAHVLVVPSEVPTSFPRLVLEAFAAGVPVVGTALGTAASALKEGRTGLTFDPGNAHALEQQVRALLSSKSARDAMVARARKLVEDEYALGFTVGQIERLLREAAAGADS